MRRIKHLLHALWGHGWIENPWVWILEFETICANVDAVLGEEV